MSKYLKNFLILVAISITVIGYPALAADKPVSKFAKTPGNLQPCDFFTAYYAGKVRERMNRGVSGSELASLIIQPAFAPESGYWVGVINGNFYLRYVTFNSSYWGAASKQHDENGNETVDFDKAKVGIAVYQARIEEGLADLLHSVVGQSVSNAERSEYVGLDGSYYVFSYGNGSCAEIWSPARSSRLRKLVNIIMELKTVALAHAGSTREKIENTIIKKLENYSADSD